ncbi:MAG: CehA/McbA family metallohydrolase [candidate division WOR-3 bacterium]
MIPHGLFFLSLNFALSNLFGYNLYYANLHSHTRYSDGRGTPAHAFAYARDTARIHILAITDHGEMLDSFEWADTKRQADLATIPGVFLGLVGFEWTSWTYGHINVFNTPDYTNRDSTPTVDSLYRWIANQPGAIGQFNHPWPTAFNSFAHNAWADTLMILYEMQNSEQANWYYIALDSGWRIGIAANQDNHFADWGMGKQLTGIWADSLEKNSIISAIKAMRTFGTLDRNFQLWFKVNDHWMGSTIPGGEINFEVFAFDPDSQDFIQRIDIITNGNTIVDSLILGNTNYATWQTKLSHNSNRKGSYYFTRVIENDSEYVISSPIWIESSATADNGNKTDKTNSFAIYPNPFTAQTNLLFLDSFFKGLKTIEIYSANGKKIKSLTKQIFIVWDGKDDFGSDVSPGVYFLLLEGKNQKVGQKIIRLAPK